MLSNHNTLSSLTSWRDKLFCFTISGKINVALNSCHLWCFSPLGWCYFLNWNITPVLILTILKLLKKVISKYLRKYVISDPRGLWPPSNTKRAGARWQICVDAFGFAGGYTQLNYQYQMTSSPATLAFGTLSPTYISPFPSRSLHLCRRDMCMYFSCETAGCVPGSLSPVQKEKRAEREREDANALSSNTHTHSTHANTHLSICISTHEGQRAALFLLGPPRV